MVLPAFAAAHQRRSGVRLRGRGQRRVHRLDDPGRYSHWRQPRRLVSGRRTATRLLGFLNGMQASSGLFYHIGTIPSVPLLTTSQAIVALRRRAYPL